MLSVAGVEGALLVACACSLEVTADSLEHGVCSVTLSAESTCGAAGNAILAYRNDLADEGAGGSGSGGGLSRCERCRRGQGEDGVLHGDRLGLVVVATKKLRIVQKEREIVR